MTKECVSEPKLACILGKLAGPDTAHSTYFPCVLCGASDLKISRSERVPWVFLAQTDYNTQSLLLVTSLCLSGDEG